MALAFSSVSCVNPSMTFMALTARAVVYADQQLKTGVIQQYYIFKNNETNSIVIHLKYLTRKFISGVKFCKGITLQANQAAIV